MTELPQISRMKFGVIDADYMNNVADAVNDYNTKKDSIARLLANTQKKKADKILVKILGRVPWQYITYTRYAGLVTSTSYVAWKYEVQTVYLAASGDPFAVDTDPIIDSDTFQDYYGASYAGYAYNLAEISNIYTTPTIFGIDMEGEDYPAGYEPQPIPTGSVILASRYKTSDVAVIFLFDRQGVHSGTCE